MLPERLARAVCFLASVAIADAAVAPTPRAMTSQLRTELLESAWFREVRAGPIPLESTTLQFFSSGAFIERVYDDTGRHDFFGTWRLVEAPGSVTLVLEGVQPRTRGHFAVTGGVPFERLVLRPVVGGSALSFTRTRRFHVSERSVGPPPTAPPR